MPRRELPDEIALTPARLRAWGLPTPDGDKSARGTVAIELDAE